MSLFQNRRDIVVAIVLLLIVIASAAPGFDALALRMDDGALLLYPELILKGWVPYRDFETYYGPANPYLLAGVYAIFHPEILVARTVGLLYHLAILAAIFSVVRPRGLILSVGSVLIAHLFLLPTGLTPFPWLGGLACAMWSIVLLGGTRFCVSHGSDDGPPGLMRPLLAGILGSIALLFRPDLVLAVILPAGLLLYFQPSRVRWNYLAGFALGLIPMLVLISIAGFQNIFDNLFLYPVIITNPARKLPWTSVPTPVVHLLILHIVVSITNVFAGFLALRRDASAWGNRLFTATALLSLATTHQAFQRMDSGHILLCCFFSLALLPTALGIVSERWIPALAARNRSLALIAIASLITVAAAPGIIQVVRRSIGLGGPSKQDDVVFLEHRGRRFPIESIPVATETGSILDRVSHSASPGQRLFVGPADLRRTCYNDTFIYHLLPQLTPATYFLEMNPLSANRPGSRLAADILSADWLILDHRLDEWNEPNASSRLGSDEPNQIVQANFTLVTKQGAYEIYRRN